MNTYLFNGKSYNGGWEGEMHLYNTDNIPWLCVSYVSFKNYVALSVIWSIHHIAIFSQCLNRLTSNHIHSVEHFRWAQVLREVSPLHRFTRGGEGGETKIYQAMFVYLAKLHCSPTLNKLWLHKQGINLSVCLDRSAMHWPNSSDSGKNNAHIVAMFSVVLSI